jgi:hypothetical protein
VDLESYLCCSGLEYIFKNFDTNLKHIGRLKVQEMLYLILRTLLKFRIAYNDSMYFNSMTLKNMYGYVWDNLHFFNHRTYI